MVDEPGTVVIALKRCEGVRFCIRESIKELFTGISGIPSMPSLFGSVRIEAIPNPMNTKAPERSQESNH